VYGARASDVRHVIVDGRLVVKDGRLRTAKVEEIRREANNHAARLLRRARI
jgi:cytosine/adenosine deaminase-related metal-dependent hydrolase